MGLVGSSWSGLGFNLLTLGTCLVYVFVFCFGLMIFYFIELEILILI